MTNTAPRVYPLEWVHPSRPGTLTRVITDFGVYRVWTHTEANGRWFWSLDGYVKISGEGDSEKEMQAAAQADYEARVLAALEPQEAEPDSKDERIKVLESTINALHGPLSVAALEARAGEALASLEAAVVALTYSRPLMHHYPEARDRHEKALKGGRETISRLRSSAPVPASEKAAGAPKLQMPTDPAEWTSKGIEDRSPKQSICELIEMHKSLLAAQDARERHAFNEPNLQSWADTVLRAMLTIGDLSHPVQGWQTPEGYALVPVEPTQAMLDEADRARALPEDYIREVYAAMIASAPLPAGPSSKDGDAS